MISRTTRRFFVIPLVFTIVSAAGFAARADDAAQRTFAFCDKNKDGKLGPGEFDSIPVSMRDWLAAHGPQAKTGIPKVDFLRLYPKMMAELRKQTPVASGAGDVASRPVDPTPDPTPANARTSKEPVKPVLYASTPPSDDLMETVRPTNLPSGYQEADLDQDGQIDYFKWRKAKLGDFAKFQELDLNNDSVLSALELGGGGVPVGGTSSGPSSSSSTSGSSSTSSSESPATTVPSSSDPEKQYIEKVKSYFYYMDGQGEKYGLGTYQYGNKNGVLDPNEWNGSSRIKPVFEKAKIDISKPMDEKTFILHYRKLFPEPGKTKTSSPGSDDRRTETKSSGRNGGTKKPRTRRRR